MIAWDSLGDINLLIVEDDSFSILLIRNILREISQLQIYEASDGFEALEVLSEYPVDVILLDYHMPGMNGYETLIEIRKNRHYDKIVILPITTDDEEKKKFYLQGADDFISKPFKIEELESKIYDNLLTKRQNRPRNNIASTSLPKKEIERNQKEFFQTFIRSRTHLDSKKRHRLESIALISKEFALKLGFNADEADNIYYATLIRDIGQYGSSNQQAELSEDSFGFIHRGYQMLEGSVETDFIHTARTIILQYREHYDGSGVPDGLTKNEISIEAHLVTIVENFETQLTQKSRGKRLYSPEQVYKLLHVQKGKQFNPELLTVFLEYFSEFVMLHHKLHNSFL